MADTSPRLVIGLGAALVLATACDGGGTAIAGVDPGRSLSRLSLDEIEAMCVELQLDEAWFDARVVLTCTEEGLDAEASGENCVSVREACLDDAPAWPPATEEAESECGAAGSILCEDPSLTVALLDRCMQQLTAGASALDCSDTRNDETDLYLQRDFFLPEEVPACAELYESCYDAYLFFTAAWLP